MKKILLSPWLAIITLLVFVGIRAHDPTFVESVRLRYFDQLITSQPTTQVPIHVINIDEAAMSKYGQFPFSRDIYADIIRDLYRRNAGLVVFGVMMPEKDRFNRDGDLANVLKDYAVILPSLGYTSSKNTAHGGQAIVIGGDPHGKVVEFPGMISNIDMLGELASGVGIVNTFPEVDGVVRRTPLVILHKDKLYPSLALETLRVAAGDRSFQVKIGEGGIEALRVPKFGKITTDNLSRVWIDWAAAATSHSLVELPKSFNGEIVIVGVSAAGIANPVATSKGEVWPQDLQAAAIGTMIAGATIQRPQWSDTAELIIILVIGAAVIAMSRFFYIGMLFCALAMAFTVSSSFYAYANWRFLIDATIPVIAIMSVALHAYSVKFITEFYKRLQIKRQFGSYVNPAIVERLQKNPEFINLGGEKRDLTIVMSDMRNFTGLGETYGEDVVAFTKMMNRYMTAISQPILDNNGCLIKFIGDASLHVHGAPIQEEQDPDHVIAAVRTALEMLTAVENFNKEIELEGKPHVGLGLGINTGPTLIGNIGAKTRFGYDVLGDSVSLAARLESQTKNYGVLIILSESTQSRVYDSYFTVKLDRMRVKGKNDAVTIYTVFYNPAKENADKWHRARELHNRMLDHYQAQEWDKARGLCTVLTGEFDGKMDEYYQIWMERMSVLETTALPADWDGIFTATSK